MTVASYLLIWDGQDLFQMYPCGRSRVCGAGAVTTSMASNTSSLIKVFTPPCMGATCSSIADDDFVVGYPSSPYTLRPFTEPELEAVQGAERDRRAKFNQLLSSIRIRVEHAFGRLKARFPALYSLTPADDIHDTYRTIHAMMVLHNLCIDLDDHPTADFPDQSIPEFAYDEQDIELPAYGGLLPEEPTEIPVVETEGWLRRKGHEKRLQMLDYLLPIQY